MAKRLRISWGCSGVGGSEKNHGKCILDRYAESRFEK